MNTVERVKLFMSLSVFWMSWFERRRGCPWSMIRKTCLAALSRSVVGSNPRVDTRRTDIAARAGV